MSDGVFISDRPQLAIARQTVSFASLGLNDPTLTRIIYEVGNPYLSYVPTDEFNPISGITEGKSYLLYLNSFFDGSPALANAVLTNLIPQTSTNVFAGERVVFLCTSSVSFATAGINATNTNLITLVSEGYFTSYDPNDSINGIDGFVEGELYDIDPITDIDLHLYGVTKIRYSDEVLYLDSLEDVVVTNSNPSATLPLAEEEVLVRNLTTGVWENKPVSDLPGSYTDANARAAISLTTTGTSGAATYNNSTGVLNVPNYNTGITTETDPTVPTLVKNIPVSADAATNKYLNWNGSAYTRKQIAYSELSGIPTIPTDTNIYNTDGTLAGNRTITGNNKYLALTGGRWEEAKGADVASANNLTLGNDGNTFKITGATQINAITNTNWQAGSRIFLIFASTPTIKHNTAGSAGTSVLLLAGAVDYAAAANDVLALIYDGTSWHEIGRKIAATGGSTPGIDSVLAVGQALTTNRTIAAGTNRLNVTGSNTGGVISASSTSGAGAAAALVGSGASCIGVSGASTSGKGGSFSSSSSYGLIATSTTGVAMQAAVEPSSTSTVVPVLEVERTTTGTAANGIGGSIDYINETSNGSIAISNQIISKWTNVTTLSRVSQLVFTAVNAAVTVDVLSLGGEGYMKLNPITATAASAITPSAGMVVFVNSTNGTFTSVGFWGFDGTSWNKF